MLFSVYNKNGYVELVANLADEVINCAVAEVKALPEYPEKGEVRCSTTIIGYY